MLGDAQAHAPLAPVFDVLETLSLNIGLAVEGAGVGGMTALSPPAGALSGWAVGGGRLVIGGSVRHGAPVQAPTAEPSAAGKAVRGPTSV